MKHHLAQIAWVLPEAFSFVLHNTGHDIELRIDLSTEEMPKTSESLQGCNFDVTKSPIERKQLEISESFPLQLLHYESNDNRSPNLATPDGRKMEFRIRLLLLAKYYHRQHLKTLPSYPTSLNWARVKVWHANFDVDGVPDVPQVCSLITSICFIRASTTKRG